MKQEESVYHRQALSELIALYFETQKHYNKPGEFPPVGNPDELKATMECILKDMLDKLMGPGNW